MKKIAIIGGSGFIGTNLISRLSESENLISIFDIAEPPALPPNCFFIHLDIRESDANFGLLSEFDYIYILAALLGKRCKEEPENGWKTNIAGLCNILNHLSKKKERPVLVFTSSCMVYDDEIVSSPIPESHPLKSQDLYGISKIYGEYILQACCKAHGFAAHIFRFFTVFGEGPASPSKGHFISIWIDMARRSQLLTIFGDGEQTIDLTHVSDVVTALTSVISINYLPGTFEIYNVATGTETKVNDIAKWFKRVKPDIQFSYTNGHPLLMRRKVADIRKAGKLLNYKPEADAEKELIRLLTKEFAAYNL